MRILVCGSRDYEYDPASDPGRCTSKDIPSQRARPVTAQFYFHIDVSAADWAQSCHDIGRLLEGQDADISRQKQQFDQAPRKGGAPNWWGAWVWGRGQK